MRAQGVTYINVGLIRAWEVTYINLWSMQAQRKPVPMVYQRKKRRIGEEIAPLHKGIHSCRPGNMTT